MIAASKTPGVRLEQADIDRQLEGLYNTLGVRLEALDSLGLIHLIDKIEEGFGIRIGLVDLDPVKMKQHAYIVQVVTKYAVTKYGL